MISREFIKAYKMSRNNNNDDKKREAFMEELMEK